MEMSMGQSISSTGGKKQKGARRQQQDQPGLEPGQKMRDQGDHKAGKTEPPSEKPFGGADHGPRSVR